MSYDNQRKNSNDDLIEELNILQERNVELEAECLRLKSKLTEQDKETEEKFKLNEGMFQALFQNSTVGVLVVDIETNKFKFANQTICQILGYSNSELTKLGIPDIHSKESHDLVFADFEARKAGKETTTSKRVPCIRKDGQIIYANISSSRLITNREALIIAFITDVTEYVKMEKELKENQYYFGMIEEFAHTGLWMFDFIKDELIWSDGVYEILQVPLSQRPSIEHLFRYVHPSDIRYVRDTWAEALNGESIDIEFRIVVSNEEKWVNIQMGFEYDNNTKPVKGIGIIVDITERKLLENEKILYREQLFKADKLRSLGILVSGVAHEINNPNLRIMIGVPILKKAWDDVLKILKSYCSELDFFSVSGMPFQEACNTIPELLDNMGNSSAQIKRIVNELKDYAVDKNSKLILEKCDLNNALKSAVSLLQNMINRSTDKFSIKYGVLPTIKGDINKLEQVLVNLIQNACQALTDKTQAINIRSFCDRSNNVVIEIEDEGEGMSEEDTKHLFEPFFTKKRDIGGTGLGLSISQKIIKEQGGRLLFNSELGEGTTVRILLPASD